MTTGGQALSSGAMERDPLWSEWCRRPANQKQLSFPEWKEERTRPAMVAAVTKISAAAQERVTTRVQHTMGTMNGLEKRYAQHLELRRQTGEIRAWKFEPLKLRLAAATFYSPDFLVQMPDGAIELHEAKGHWEDDARVKVKVAAREFPCFRIVAVRWDKNAKDWKYEEFKA